MRDKTPKTSKSQATWVRKQFDRILKQADCVTIDDGPVLSLGENGPDDESLAFYVSWMDEGDQESCRIPESSFDPENKPRINPDGNFELKDNKGYNTIISFFKLTAIRAKL